MGIVFCLYVICCLYAISYQTILFIVLWRHKNPAKLGTSSPSVSILVCAKNEAENLRHNLPYILNQEYPNFELILVNDGSDDNTEQVIQDLHQTDKRVSCITITKEEKKGLGKKYALQKGVEYARNELILLTDADCRPTSTQWISEMTANTSATKKIVLGISPYERKNTLLNGLIEYETCQTALQYCGLAALGMPYMSVGRNVCYERSLLLSKQWTEEELSVASGDDDLAIQTLATPENTTICISEVSYTISLPKENWKAWVNQKIRHYSSGNLYKWTHRWCLGSYLTAKTAIHACIMILVISGYNLNKTVYFYVGYVCSIVALNLGLQIYLHLNSRWYFAPVFDLLFSITTPLFGCISRLKTREDWK